MLGSVSEAEDVVQEALLRVHQVLDSGEQIASPRAFVATVTTRLAINELRKPELARIESEPEGIERADVAAERRRLGRAIAEGVAALPDAQRAVFVLREYHGLEYQEIADALEIELDTVKSRLSRARASLRERLAPIAGRNA